MPRSHQRVLTYLLWGCAGYVGLAAAVWLLPLGGPSFQQGFWDLYPLIIHLVAAIGAWNAVRSPGIGRKARIGWAAVGFAVVCHAVADVCWYHSESIGLTDPAGDGLVNALYLSTYIGFIVGTASFIRDGGRRSGLLSILDGIVVSGSVGLAAWDRFFRFAWETSPLPVSAKALTSAFPFADLVLLTGAACLILDLRRRSAAATGPVIWVAALCTVVWADVAYCYQVLSGTYQSARWLDFFWLVGFTLVAYTSVVAGRRSGTASAVTAFDLPETAKPSGLFPAAFALLVATAVFVADAWSGVGPAVSTLWIGIVLFGIAVVRQVVQSAWQRSATETALRQLAEELERQAVDRTRRLTGMLQLAHAVNSTLEVEKVLQAAADEVFKAIPCDGLAVWQGGVDASADGDESPVEKGPLAAELLRSRELLEVDDARTVPCCTSAPRAQVLAAPLRTATERVGWVALLRAESDFSAEDAKLLNAMGEIVGPALDHAVTYRRVSLSTNLDPVTGLLNHRAVHQLLDALFDRAKEEELELTVLMADLANFRMFNTTYGHPVGDQVLNVVAGVLQAECSKGAVIGRFGGDEFIVVLPNWSSEAATKLAARFNRRLQSGYKHSEGQIIPLSLCAGIATFPADCDTYEELLDMATRNLASARIGDYKVVCTSLTQQAAKSLRADPTYETLDVLVAAVDNKDAYTRRHSEEVAEYAQYAAQEMGCSEDELRLIQTAALLHDVGKIGVPPEILGKPARLTQEETAIINRHAWIGSMIVSAFPGPDGLAEIIKCHHERWDGRGYPDGRKGEDIPWISRLLAIADTYSAMTTDRPYRRALTWETALGEIAKQAGSQFDPDLAAAFVKAIGAQMSVDEALRGQSVSSRAA